MVNFSEIPGKTIMGRLLRLPLRLISLGTGLIYFTKIVSNDVRECVHAHIDNGEQRKLVHLDIEPTNICNANCVFCAYQYQQGSPYKIDYSFAEKLLDSFCAAGGGDIGLTPVVGEPLLVSNLERLIAMCRSRKEIKNIGLTTNGILLTHDKFIKFKEAGLSHLVISMTYPDATEYKQIFRSNGFQRLMYNLNQLMLVDKGQIEICLAVRTPRLLWKNHPLFGKARLRGWSVESNLYFDDWSGRVADDLVKHRLLRRPLRGRHLPCTILQSGPHALASGRITACGCRDLEGKSEIADEKIFQPFYDIGDLKAVYEQTIEPLRQRFLSGKPPSICASCRHYNPEFRFALAKDRLFQTVADLRAALEFLFCLRT